MKPVLVLLLITLACCCSSASFYQCAVVQDIMSLMLHGSESDVKSALEKYSASKLAITAVTTLKQSVDKLSQEEKNGYKTLVEKVLEKC
ncbi:uteroglobin-like isoform X2 [Podarcis raffonei]|uniref:uteroglobin-like isoform X2 n=1 Tax=Podarcis raffonei TaxID=65483 RepID=UPI002329833B|nr:uteroglobin-like isoform X2 [Podarcis raffonei]